MQETGNNISQSNNVLSIRLSSNGQYFSVSDDGSPIVQVTLDTDQLVLVPVELFKPELAESYLKINSIPVDQELCAVVSAETEGIVAVMGWKRKEIDSLSAQFAGRLEFTSPLLTNIARKEKNSMAIGIESNRAYITLYNDKLEYAECLPYSTIADILYYVENLKGLFGLAKRSIYVNGDNAKSIVQTLKQYYRKVILRDN